MTAISTFDEKTLKLGSALHVQYRHPTFVFFRYIYLALIPLGLFLLFVFKDQTFGILCLMIGPVLYSRKIFWQYRLLQNAKRSPEHGQEVQWTFTKKGFQQKSTSHQLDFKWSQITERYLSPKGILLYLSKEQYFVLPSSAFKTPSDFEKVTTLIRDRTS